MARTPKASTSTAVANWDEELARSAQAGAALAPQGGGGTFFSLRAGVLSFDDVPLPGNQMLAVVGSWCLENIYYDDVFDPDNITPPTCFAFCKEGDEAAEMGPPSDTVKDDCFTWQNETCKGCEQNEWGSARTGKGKACSNRRRLALLSAGVYVAKGKNQGYELEVYEDPAHYKKAEIAYLKVPVMSGKGFDAYVKQIADTMKRPLWAVLTHIWVEPDPKSQFKVHFEVYDKVPNELLEVMRSRHEEMAKGIDFPYRPAAEQDEATTRTAAKVGRKVAPAKGKR